MIRAWEANGPPSDPEAMAAPTWTLYSLSNGECNDVIARGELKEGMTVLAATRAAKAAAGLSGLACERQDVGSYLELKPYGLLSKLCIDWNY